VNDPLSTLLDDIGDHLGASAWRRLLSELDADLRIAKLARLDQSFWPLPGDASWVEIGLTDAPDDLEDASAQTDRLLSCHAAVAVTPYTAALGAAERKALEAAATRGLPARRALVLIGEGLLARVSDDPAAEAAQVRDRVRAVAPPGWPLLSLDELPAWVANARADRRALTLARRRDAARLILADAARRNDAHRAIAGSEASQAEASIGQTDAEIDLARKRGRRAAAHLLSALRRGTETLLVDLRDLLLELEADLPAQIQAVPDLRAARRGLPHWLQHVVQGWLRERLTAWQHEVHRELLDLGLRDDDLQQALLVVPAIVPPPLKGETDWSRRVGATVAMGGGAALAFAGLWLPALLAVGGGFAWSSLSQSADVAGDRRQLVDAATAAVRRMSTDAERLFREQLQHGEAALADWGEEQASALAADRAEHRRRLEASYDAAKRRVEALEHTARRIQSALADASPALEEDDR
jgi:hypothetical protein